MNISGIDLTPPHDFDDDDALYRFAYNACRAFRRENGLENHEDAEFFDYQDSIEDFLEKKGIARLIRENGDYDNFMELIMECWEDSASGNKFKFDCAVEEYNKNPLAYPHPNLAPHFRKAATFCHRLAQQHGGASSTWYLSSRKLGEVLEVDWTTAARYLRVLASVHVIQKVREYSRGRRKATEYKIYPKDRHT